MIVNWCVEIIPAVWVIKWSTLSGLFKGTDFLTSSSSVGSLTCRLLNSGRYFLWYWTKQIQNNEQEVGNKLQKGQNKKKRAAPEYQNLEKEAGPPARTVSKSWRFGLSKFYHCIANLDHFGTVGLRPPQPSISPQLQFSPVVRPICHAKVHQLPKLPATSHCSTNVFFLNLKSCSTRSLSSSFPSSTNNITATDLTTQLQK